MDIRLQSLKVAEKEIPARGKLRVYVPKQFTDLQEGREATLFNVHLAAPPQPRNPGEFDYAFYLNIHGFVATGQADSIHIIPTQGFSLSQWMMGVRRAILSHIEKVFQQPYAGFMKALLIGKRGELDPTVRRQFQLAGLMHVLAISGLHVGFITVLILLVLQWLGVPLVWRYGILIGILVWYAALTGAKPPVIRAMVMIGLWAIARMISRKSNPLNLLFAAGFIILLVQPNQLFWVGFQLSFLAVLFILIGLQWVNGLRWFQRLHDSGRGGRLVANWIVLPAAVTLWAQLGTLPVLVHNFHLLSPVALVLNLIVVPVISLVLYGGVACVILSVLFPAAAMWIGALISGVLTLLFHLVEWAIRIPFSYIPIHQGTLWAAGISALAVSWTQVQEKRWRWILTYVIGFSLVFAHLFVSHSSGWNVLAIDVGQGDALLIQTPRQQSILVDTGAPVSNGYRPFRGIEAVLRTLNISRINRLVISHPHWDHMGNVNTLLDAVAVDSVYFPRFPYSYRMMDSLKTWLARKDVPSRAVRAGDIIPVDASTRMYILAPLYYLATRMKYSRLSGRIINNASIVALLQMGKTRVLLPGDVERGGEEAVLPWGNWLQAAVLKVPHHGSKTSSIPQWIAAIKPRWAIISVGEKNRFQHPSPGVIARYRTAGARVMRTDAHGAVWLKTDGNQWEVVDWQPRERFYAVHKMGEP